MLLRIALIRLQGGARTTRKNRRVRLSGNKDKLGKDKVKLNRYPLKTVLKNRSKTPFSSAISAALTRNLLEQQQPRLELQVSDKSIRKGSINGASKRNVT